MAMGGTLLAQGKVEQAEISAIVTRADGTVEDLGVVSYWHRNPLRRWAWACGKLWRDLKRSARQGRSIAKRRGF